MSILLDGVCVIVRADALEARYPGGCAGFARDAGIDSYRRDDHLVAVSFYERRDATCVVAQLIHAGFELGGQFACDIAVFDSGGELWQPCLWLEISENDDGLAIGSLAGVDAESIGVPPYFDEERVEDSLGSLYRLTDRQLRRRLAVQGREEGCLLLLDRKTGQTRRAGMPILRH